MRNGLSESAPPIVLDMLTRSAYTLYIGWRWGQPKTGRDEMKKFDVTFYVKADELTPATAENTQVTTLKAGSEWNAHVRMRERLCREYPSGMGGSKAVILSVEPTR